ncbi:MAG: hypothetical protein RLZZ399_680 [Verrucomicrobiota bacterium]
MENSKTLLEGLRGLVVIDEAQREPRLFPVLRVLADRPGNPATFLILGSASPELSRQSSESLAGRVEIIEMQGLNLGKTGAASAELLWHRGGFPRSFLAANEGDSFDWRRNFIRTFLERDLGVLGFGMAPAVMGRFWTMLAHYHGQIWNGSAYQPEEAYFYAVHSSCELDLLMFLRGKRVGVEFKRADAPTLSRSMRTVIADLALDELWVIYPGSRSYPLADQITVLPLLDCVVSAPRGEG